MSGTLVRILVIILALGSICHAQTSKPVEPAKPQPSSTPQNACGCELPLPEELAIVNGVKIIPQNISAETQKRIQKLYETVIETRQRELDLQINSLLLRAEAKKRGVSTTKLLDLEIVSQTKEPSEADAQALFEKEKSRLGGTEFSRIKGEIISYLREQRQSELAGLFAKRLRSAAQMNLTGLAVSPPLSDADRARVFATVNGKTITSADIEKSLRPLIFQTQQQVYEWRLQEVNVQINDMLLAAEAQKKSLAPSALLNEVTTNVVAITDAEAQKFFEQNKERINGEFAGVKDQIVIYLKEQAQKKARAAFAQQLRAGASVKVFLIAPEPPIYEIAVDDQPARGNPNAKVTFIEFTDFECEACGKIVEVSDRLFAEYGDRVRFVVRDYPLTQHTFAFKAAEAAEAAREQGKYWEYAAILSRSRQALQIEKLKEYASNLRLDRPRFDAALDSGKFADQISRDLSDGVEVGVSATPTIFVNGKRSAILTYENLKAMIEEALKQAAPRAGQKP
jgi:protein-disulfide isomerase